MNKIYDKYFVEDKKLLDELSTAELREPRIEIKYDNYSRNTFYSHFEIYKGKVLERVFAFNKKHGRQEIIRRIQGNSSMVIRNVYLSSMAGWIVVWDNKKYIGWYWSNEYFNLWRKEWAMYLNYNDSQNNLEHFLKTAKLKKKYQYILNAEYYKNVNFIYAISIYDKIPQIELLLKTDKGYLLDSIAVLKKLEKNDKHFMKIIYKYRNEYMLASELLSVNKGKDLQEIRARKKAVQILKNCRMTKKDLGDDVYNKMLDNTEYIINTESSYIYNDYLRLCKKLKIDLNDKRVLFPKPDMLIKLHDQYAERISDIENKDVDIKISKVKNKYKKLIMCGAFKMEMPSKTIDLIKEGREMHNCVGSCSYNVKMSEERSLIFFIKTQDNKSLATLEFDPKKKKILQFFGVSNSRPPEDVDLFIRSKWLKQIKMI